MTRIAEACVSSLAGAFVVLACGSGQGTTSDPSTGASAAGAVSSSGGKADAASGAAAVAGAPSGGGASNGGAVAAAGGLASGDAGTPGEGAVPAWCAAHSSDCLAALERCSAYAACQADPACSATLDAFSACTCDIERAGGFSTSGTFADCQSKLGAAGSLSGDAGACWKDTSSGASLICGLAVTPGCNQLQVRDPMVQELKNPLQTPSYTGGSIPDGTYTLSSHTQYMAGGIGPVEAAGEWATLQIAGNTWQLVTVIEQQGGTRSSETVTVSRSTVTAMQTCPAAQALAPFSYTATDTTLTLNNGTELVFTKLAE